MKNLVTAFAACMIAGLVSADGVESQNIVGYKADVSIAANNYTMLTSPFVPVGGVLTTGTSIQSLFTDQSSLTAGDALSTADNILVWVPAANTYAYYYYSTNLGDPTWVSLDDEGTATDATIPVGAAFWYNRLGTQVNGLTMAGQVVTSNVVITVAADNYTMVGNPYAADLAINGTSDWANATAGDALSTSDSILVWLPAANTYAYYYYSTNLGDSTWVSLDDEGTATSAVIPASGAFWYNRLGANTTVTLKAPYTL